MRCWVQMTCSDSVLFDSVAAFTHGLRITMLEGNVAPTSTMLWHKSRALKGLQAKISVDTDDGELTWTANETILATFYLMEAAARFGYVTEFKTHCLGLIRMMQLRGEISSGCLKDLFVMQAVGLVESTEMAAELRHGIDSNDGNQPSSIHSTYTNSTSSTLQFSDGDFQPGQPSLTMMETLPGGFSDLAALGNLSTEFVGLLDQLLGCINEDQIDLGNDVITEPIERQTRVMKRARLLEKQSNHAVERLACLGLIAFLTRRTSPTHLFPETASLHKLRSLGSQTVSSNGAGMPYYRELRIWATIVGAEMANTAGAALKEDADKIMDELFLQESWINDWDDVERIMKRYLWDGTALATWKMYWMSCKMDRLQV